MIRAACRSKVKLTALGMVSEYIFVLLTVGRAAYRHNSSPDTPTGYSTMNRVYLVKHKRLN